MLVGELGSSAQRSAGDLGGLIGRRVPALVACLAAAVARLVAGNDVRLSRFGAGCPWQHPGDMERDEHSAHHEGI